MTLTLRQATLNDIDAMLAVDRHIYTENNSDSQGGNVNKRQARLRLMLDNAINVSRHLGTASVPVIINTDNPEVILGWSTIEQEKNGVLKTREARVEKHHYYAEHKLTAYIEQAISDLKPAKVQVMMMDNTVAEFQPSYKAAAPRKISANSMQFARVGNSSPA